MSLKILGGYFPGKVWDDWGKLIFFEWAAIPSVFTVDAVDTLDSFWIASILRFELEGSQNSRCFVAVAIKGYCLIFKSQREGRPI